VFSKPIASQPLSTSYTTGLLPAQSPPQLPSYLPSLSPTQQLPQLPSQQPSQPPHPLPLTLPPSQQPPHLSTITLPDQQLPQLPSQSSLLPQLPPQSLLPTQSPPPLPSDPLSVFPSSLLPQGFLDPDGSISDKMYYNLSNFIDYAGIAILESIDKEPRHWKYSHSQVCGILKSKIKGHIMTHTLRSIVYNVLNELKARNQFRDVHPPWYIQPNNVPINLPPNNQLPTLPLNQVGSPSSFNQPN